MIEINELNETITNKLPEAFKPIAEQTEDRLVSRGILDRPDTTSSDQSAQLAAQAQEIVELKAALDAQRKLGENRPVELKNGEQVTTKAASSHLEYLQTEVELARLHSARYAAELAAQRESEQPLSFQKPLLNREEAEKLLGRTAWERLSSNEKARVLDTRKSDVDGLKVEDYFGAKSSSRNAHELNKRNPGLYKLLRAKAEHMGLIG